MQESGESRPRTCITIIFSVMLFINGVSMISRPMKGAGDSLLDKAASCDCGGICNGLSWEIRALRCGCPWLDT